MLYSSVPDVLSELIRTAFVAPRGKLFYDIIIAGEITSVHKPNYKALVMRVLYHVGLADDFEKYRITTHITHQSADIALGVDQDGAGDQGMMFGYATDETREMLPLPYVLATEALDRLRELRSPILLPDAKCQVTYDYSRKRIDTFLMKCPMVAM